MTASPELPGSGTVAARVSELLGVDRVELGEEGTPASSPRSEEEAVAMLRVAAEGGWRVLPTGHGLAPARERDGGPGEAPSGGEARPDLILSSLGLTGIVDHEPGDLTVRARAGETLGAVQAAVSAAGQWLPLDPPAGSESTLGGIAATGLGGPLSAGYGRPRDQILGLTVVDGSGRALSLGGRVVKNVAGFDLVGLVVGSRGALGLITEIVFRLYPLPEEDRTLVWIGRTPMSAWETGRAAATVPVPVAAAELLAGAWPSPIPTGEARVLIRLTGSSKQVEAIAEKMRGSVGEADHELSGDASRSLWETVSRAEGAAASGDEGSTVPEPSLRGRTLPSRVPELLAALDDVPTRRLAASLLHGAFRAVLARSGGQEDGGDTLRALIGTPNPRRGGAGSSGSSAESQRRVDRLRADIVRGFDPKGLLPGAWRDGWLRAAR